MDEKLGMILKTSGTLFRKYGIRSISMDDIAKELSMSKKTLYQYVENKTDLIEKLLKHVVSDSTSCITEGDVPMNAIDILLQVSVRVSDEIKELNPSIAFDLEKFYPVLYRNFVNAKREHVYKKIKENLEQGGREGIYRTDLDADLVAKLYVQKLIDVHDPEFLSSVDFSQEKVFQVMFDNHIRGIANPAGLAYYEEQIKK
ncbi:MAG: TetR/AcrR family transcriptional regulator [Lentimicrobiaceae bacterium]|nr:TetR/AcrR family transcriptional regulator [Lentimicrobiaceae bacterium]HPG32815.1 TetR/AcrR family transcriptional regulator [Lentimicrobium sp.]